MSLRSALRRAHSTVTRYAPADVTVYRATYGSDDDPFDATSQASVTTHALRAVFTPGRTNLEPTADAVTHTGTLSYRYNTLGFVLEQGDYVEIGGVVYNVTDSADVQGAVVVAQLSGPTSSPVGAADETAPRITESTLTTGVNEFDFTATISESSTWRVRYRTPPLTGEWQTLDFNDTPTTSIVGNVGAVEPTTYEVAVQARDEAGNVGAWFDLGNVAVTGVPQT